MSGQGHAKCSNTKTGEQFITEAKAKHGDKYGYDKVNYVGIESPVIITCPTHGDFTQTPHGHLKGYGCQKCGRATTGEKTRNDADEYFEQAKIKHNDKFDYSKAVYISLSKLLTIICPVHGEFTQRADSHLKHGCEQCHYDSKVTTSEDFISASKAIHGDKYNYDEVDYVRNNKNVIIICPIHGRYEKIPSEHIRTPTHARKPGGCPVCVSSNGEKNHL